MKNYYCQDCNEIFSEDQAKAVLTEWGYGSKEVYACPNCRSTDITDAGKCKTCGKPIDPSEDYCDDCKRAVYKIWERAVCEVMELCEDDADYCEAENRFKEYLDDTGVI